MSCSNLMIGKVQDAAVAVVPVVSCMLPAVQLFDSEDWQFVALSLLFEHLFGEQSGCCLSVNSGPSAAGVVAGEP